MTVDDLSRRREDLDALGAIIADLQRRHQQLEATLGALEHGECLCRSTHCQHAASLHHNGVCEVCNAGICWC
jgi:hypothetical protein